MSIFVKDLETGKVFKLTSLDGNSAVIWREDYGSCCQHLDKLESVLPEKATLNFTERKVGGVELHHHSTASVIQLIIRGDGVDNKEGSAWLDYIEFENLKQALNQT